MKLRTFKVDDADWERWRKLARAAGMSLSQWIRERCNFNWAVEVPKKAKGKR